MTTGDRELQLERAIDAYVRDAPLRQAPPHLEQRVLAAIAARNARPWWRQDFLRWPLAARLVFLSAASVVIYAVLHAGAWLGASAPSALPAEVVWVRAIMQALLLIAHHLPVIAYLAGFTLVSVYAALLALGALAHRSTALRQR